MGGTSHPQLLKHIIDSGLSDFKHAPDGTYKDGIVVSPGFACLVGAASLAPLSTCPKTCRPCSEQFRPLHWQQQSPLLRYKETLSDAEATIIINRLVGETCANIARLKEQVEAHGDAILKRWTKRNQQKRRSLLQQAMPNMFERSQHYQHVVSDLRSADLGEHQTALLLQYLDLESTSEDPNMLLSMMHHRCNTKASDCVMFDSLQLKAFFSQGLLEASYNPHCVVMHDKEDNFGALVAWEKQLAHEWWIIGFPRAKLILEAQAALSSFLLKMVQVLLCIGPDEVPRGSEKWQVLADAGFAPAGALQHEIGMPRSTLHLPPTFSISSLYEAFSIQYVNARDTCWLIQTDPAYARQLLSIGETSSRHKHAFYDVKQLNLTALLLDIVERQQIWSELADEAKRALDISTRNREGSPLDSQRSEDCERALPLLESRLRCEFSRFANEFRILAATLGTFDEHLSFDVYHRAIVNTSSAAQEKDVVFWCASNLHNHAIQDKEYPGKNLETIERYSYSPMSKDRGRLHPLLLECVSGMRTIDDAIMSLLCHRPRSSRALSKDDVVALFSSIPHWESTPFKTQVNKRWSEHLDRLWPSLEAFLGLPTMSGRVTHKALGTFDANHQVAAATRITRTPTAKKATTRGQPSLPQQTTWGISSSSKSEVTTPKAKIKTRPDGTPRDSLGLAEGHDQGIVAIEAGLNALDTSHQRVKVSAATMDIVNRMFLSYGKHTQSNVRWDHFVSAMIDIGVSPSQSEGSAVTFKDETRGKGAVVLHRPHPDSSVNPICMRSFGKRLQRNFGWELGMFEERV